MRLRKTITAAVLAATVGAGLTTAATPAPAAADFCSRFRTIEQANQAYRFLKASGGDVRGFEVSVGGIACPGLPHLPETLDDLARHTGRKTVTDSHLYWALKICYRMETENLTLGKFLVAVGKENDPGYSKFATGAVRTLCLYTVNLAGSSLGLFGTTTTTVATTTTTKPPTVTKTPPKSHKGWTRRTWGKVDEATGKKEYWVERRGTWRSKPKHHILYSVPYLSVRCSGGDLDIWVWPGGVFLGSSGQDVVASIGGVYGISETWNSSTLMDAAFVPRNLESKWVERFRASPTGTFAIDVHDYNSVAYRAKFNLAGFDRMADPVLRVCKR